MDFDALGGSSPTLTSLLIQSLVTLARHNRGRHGARTPRPSRGKPVRRGAPDSPDLTPTRSWTQPIKVESLRVYEGVGKGHTLARHVNHAANADVERLERERDIPASGSFTDEATAQRGFEAAVLANTDAIRNWLSQPNQKGPFVRDLDMGVPVGSVLTRSAYNAALARGETPTLVPATIVRIVLRRSNDFAAGFFLLTAYPVPNTREDAPHFAIEPLSRYEGPGHTVSRHVDIDPGELANRLDAETDITASSRFADLATAQRAIERGIREKAGAINDWLESGHKLPFTGDVACDEVIGVVLSRGAFEGGRRQPAPANRLHFVLVKSPDYPSGFFVKTAYPVLAW